MKWLFADHFTSGIELGVLFGILARLIMLQTDYRQYPTYPHGRVIHISLGVIAAGLGAVAVPSLLEKNYTAITFLSLAAQQFRDVRNMERQSLQQMDKMELVPRGVTYIEGIAMVFEGRNYLVIFSAFITTLFSILSGWMWGVVAGILSLAFAHFYKKGKNIGQIAEVIPAEVKVNGPDLLVDSIYIMNVGLESSQSLIRQHGIGLIIKPRDVSGRTVLANLGQRQAILHDVSTILGLYRDTGEPSLLPMAKLDLNSGTLAVFLLPTLPDVEKAATAVRRVPVLESAVRMPKQSKALG